MPFKRSAVSPHTLELTPAPERLSAASGQVSQKGRIIRGHPRSRESQENVLRPRTRSLVHPPRHLRLSLPRNLPPSRPPARRPPARRHPIFRRDRRRRAVRPYGFARRVIRRQLAPDHAAPAESFSGEGTLPFSIARWIAPSAGCRLRGIRERADLCDGHVFGRFGRCSRTVRSKARPSMTRSRSIISAASARVTASTSRRANSVNALK